MSDMPYSSKLPGRDSRALALWAVRWIDDRISILSAAGIDAARFLAENNRGIVDDGWPESRQQQIRDVRPVWHLKLGVASRRELNRPRAGCVEICGCALSWRGPHSGSPGRGDREVSMKLPPASRDGARTPQKLWSYLWIDREVVLFTAANLDDAVRWAGASRYTEGRIPDADSIESIEDLQVQLARDGAGYAPTCYRAWVEGHKVGWPPTEYQNPRRGTPPPTGPLHAEARLPIPRYSLTDAYAPRDPDEHRHLRDVPWPDAATWPSK